MRNLVVTRMQKTASDTLKTVGGDSFFVMPELRKSEAEISTVEIFFRKNLKMTVNPKLRVEMTLKLGSTVFDKLKNAKKLYGG